LSIEALLWLLAILILSLSFHEAAHAWTANRLGDPTAKLLGRLTFNPMAHIDVIGTLVFPAIAIYSGFPLIGWAKPVPVDMRNLKAPRRDFAIVAVAGPISNVILAVAFAAVLASGVFATGGVAWYVVRQVIGLNVLLAARWMQDGFAEPIDKVVRTNLLPYQGLMHLAKHNSTATG